MPKFGGLMDRLFDEAFKQDENATVVLDVIPDGQKSVDQSLDHFEKRAAQYRAEHGDDALTTCVIFAYCPPQVLSERQRNRNSEALANNNPENIRRGVFTLDQLTRLVTVDDKKTGQYNLGSISKDKTLKFVAEHSHAQPPKEIYQDNKKERNKRLGVKIQEYKNLSVQLGLWKHKPED